MGKKAGESISSLDVTLDGGTPLNVTGADAGAPDAGAPQPQADAAPEPPPKRYEYQDIEANLDVPDPNSPDKELQRLKTEYAKLQQKQMQLESYLQFQAQGGQGQAPQGEAAPDYDPTDPFQRIERMVSERFDQIDQRVRQMEHGFTADKAERGRKALEGDIDVAIERVNKQVNFTAADRYNVIGYMQDEYAKGNWIKPEEAAKIVANKRIEQLRKDGLVRRHERDREPTTLPGPGQSRRPPVLPSLKPASTLEEFQSNAEAKLGAFFEQYLENR